jgi:TM2 domain-containing membrane protein YozV
LARKPADAARVWRRSVPIAYLLWLLFGLAGVHRYYLGRYVTGLLMLCLTALVLAGPSIETRVLTAMVLAVWMIADAIAIPGMAKRPPGRRDSSGEGSSSPLYRQGGFELYEERRDHNVYDK